MQCTQINGLGFRPLDSLLFRSAAFCFCFLRTNSFRRSFSSLPIHNSPLGVSYRCIQSTIQSICIHNIISSFMQKYVLLVVHTVLCMRLRAARFSRDAVLHSGIPMGSSRVIEPIATTGDVGPQQTRASGLPSGRSIWRVLIQAD